MNKKKLTKKVTKTGIEGIQNQRNLVTSCT